MNRSRLALGSLLSFLCVAYQSLYRAIPSNGDLMTALPIAKEFAHPGLYSPYDLIVSSGIREPYHLYKYLGGFLYQIHANLDLVWESLFLVFLFLTFLTIWYLSFELTCDRLSSALVLAFIAVAHPLRGSLHASAVPQEAFVVAMAAMPLALAAIVLLLRRRYLAAMALSGFVFNIHPYVGLLMAAAVGATILFVSEEPLQKRFVTVAIGGLFGLPNVIYILMHMPANFGAVGYDFYAQFRLYAMHVFVEDHWREGYGWFFMNLAGAVWFSRFIDERKNRIVRILFACWFALMAMYVLNSYVIKNTTVLLMFLFRATYFIKPIVFVFVVHGLRRWYGELRNDHTSDSQWERRELSAAIIILFVSAILPMRFAVIADVLALIAYSLIVRLKDRETSSIRLLQGVMLAIGVLSLGFLCVIEFTGDSMNAHIFEDIVVDIVVLFAVGWIFMMIRSRAEIHLAHQAPQDNFSTSRLIVAVLSVLLVHHLIISLKDRSLPFIPDITRMEGRILMHRAPAQSAALMQWARTSTPPRSLFVVPPDDFEDFGTFRIVTDRSLFITIVEVNQLSLDASVYHQAHKRVEALGVTFPRRREYDVNGYYGLSLQDLRKLAVEEHADYMIFKRGQLHGALSLLPTVYNDERFVVVDLHVVSGE